MCIFGRVKDAMKPIFLIGLPGVGKSTIGPLVAKLLGLRFVDTDHFVEARYHSSVGAMINCCGIDKFRKREKVALLELLRLEDTVLATGGGLPLWEDNMDKMLERGLVIFLDSPLDILAERLYTVKGTRPAVAEKTRTEVREYLDATDKVRRPVYSRAQLTVPVGQLRDAVEEQTAAKDVADAITTYLAETK